MVKSKVGSLSSADATEEKGDDHVVDDVADDLKLQHVMSPSALSYPLRSVTLKLFSSTMNSCT